MAKAKQVTGWENRIVESGTLPADQFLAHDKNARRHPNKQREALRGSLNSVGWIAPVIVSARTGKLLDGHARIEEALTKDEAQPVPFVKVDVSETEENLILASFDPITGLATYDREALDLLLRETSTGDVALQELMSELAAQNGVIPPQTADELWQGMPEFEQEDAHGEYHIHVHFESFDDVQDFARRLNQTITEKTRSIWHPYKAPENLKQYQMADES